MGRWNEAPQSAQSDCGVVFLAKNASKPLGWAHHWNMTHKITSINWQKNKFLFYNLDAIVTFLSSSNLGHSLPAIWDLFHKHSEPLFTDTFHCGHHVGHIFGFCYTSPPSFSVKQSLIASSVSILQFGTLFLFTWISHFSSVVFALIKGFILPPQFLTNWK